jgi:hypothetical protein
MTSRRKFLLSAFASASAFVAYPTLLEPRWFDVVRTNIKLRPQSRGRLRILQLTDLHASRVVPLSLIGSAVDAGLAENPDIVCLTGDFITSREDFDSKEYASILRKLSAAKPTYATLGNHDGGAWAGRGRGFKNHKLVDRILDEAGVELLHNRSLVLDAQGQKVVLAGVGDLWADEIDARRALQDAPADLPVVLMSHNPDSKEVLRPVPFDLMLSGHTHGGQVILPYYGTSLAAVRDHRYIAGRYDWDGRQMYISRGVGSLFGIRFRCRPEVTILDVEV